VLIGATPEGRKELLGFQVGIRESAQSWRELLVDLKARGLAIAPELATGDGALGFWKALEEVSPTTRHQRCTVHKSTRGKTPGRRAFSLFPNAVGYDSLRACRRLLISPSCREPTSKLGCWSCSARCRN